MLLRLHRYLILWVRVKSHLLARVTFATRLYLWPIWINNLLHLIAQALVIISAYVEAYISYFYSTR
jgi:hypothetical protein